MFDTLFINDIIKISGVFISSFFIFYKAVNYKQLTVRKSLLTAIFCFPLSFLYAFMRLEMPQPIVIVLLASLSIIFILIITRLELSLAISGYLISLGMSYIFYLISVLFIGSLYRLVVGNDYDSFLLFVFFLLFQLLLAWGFFEIRRFKNGFPFISKKYMIIVSLILAGIIILCSTLIGNADGSSLAGSIAISMLIIGSGIVIWIRRGLTMFYKKRMEERTVEMLEAELREKDKKIESLTVQNDTIRTANHKINKKLAALELSVKKLAFEANRGIFGSEIAAEYADVLDRIKIMAAEYENDISKLPQKKLLPTTKIKAIDSIFDYFMAESVQKNIDFNVRLNGSINYMAENIIDRCKLETMIGDHVGDAIIAVDSCDNVFRSILVILGLASDCYELTIYDSGIEFEADTLMRLGTERITTHSDSGGSGIGFMTTFETMRECAASLIIDERPPSKSDYTKSVTIRFDGKGQYIIKTYRADKFPTQNDRNIIIENN